MGEYYCEKCKVMHTDIASNICPVIRDQRVLDGKCPECGKKLTKSQINKLRDEVIYDCPNCGAYIHDYFGYCLLFGLIRRI